MSRNITAILSLNRSSQNEYHCGANWIAGVIERLVTTLPFTFINMAGESADFASLT